MRSIAEKMIKAHKEGPHETQMITGRIYQHLETCEAILMSYRHSDQLSNIYDHKDNQSLKNWLEIEIKLIRDEWMKN